MTAKAEKRLGDVVIGPRRITRSLPLGVQQRMYDALYAYHHAITARLERLAAQDAKQVLTDVETML